MPYRLVIFDLDGTLVDSLPWLLRNLDAIAERFRFTKIAELDLQALRHAGPREILEGLGVPLWRLPQITRHVRRLKSAQLSEIRLFPGADAMLRALADGGVRLALVSSDHEANVRKQLGDANVALFADFACGASLLGKAMRFKRVLRRAGIAASDAIAIGDEVRDVDAARAAGIAVGAVTWGYAAPAALRRLSPDLVFERMDEIPLAILPRA